MQVLTCLSTFGIFILLTLWTGFQPYKDENINNLNSLARYAAFEFGSTVATQNPDSIRSILSKFIDVNPRLLVAGLQHGEGILWVGDMSEVSEPEVASKFLPEAKGRFTNGRLYLKTRITGQMGNELVFYFIADATRLQLRKWNTILMGSLLFVLSLAVALLIASPIRLSLSRRIGRLVKSITNITSTGDYSRPLASPGNDELTVLVNSFNDLMTEVKNNSDRKDEFVGIASHELKTPLTAIKGYIHLAQESGTAADTKVLLKNADRAILKMEGLIRDLIEVSQIQAGSFTCEEKKLNVVALLHATTEDVRSANPVRKISLMGAPHQFMVSGDQRRLAQVIRKLLGNALRFSNAPAEVAVSYSISEKEITVRIRDFGRGVPSEDNLRIFERFYQPVRIGQYGAGFGIGLYISKAIIECHKGKIWMENEIDGSSFYFTLPIIRSLDRS